MMPLHPSRQCRLERLFGGRGAGPKPKNGDPGGSPFLVKGMRPAPEGAGTCPSYFTSTMLLVAVKLPAAIR